MLQKIGSGVKPHVHPGPLLEDLLSQPAPDLAAYLRGGGYETARRVIRTGTPGEVMSEVDRAGLRGRAGGGFPTSQKWWMVSKKESKEKYFICNANAGEPGGFKQHFLITASPHRLIEAALLAAFAVGAETGVIFLPEHFSSEARLLEQARREALEQGLLGRNVFGSNFSCELVVYRGMGGYISGEETALMELIEGKVGRPRRKPPLPVARGLFNAPTVVNNIETVLQAYQILKFGADEYRKIGTPDSPGSFVFCVSGHVRRPGIYELPLGTSLSELIFEHARGLEDGLTAKAVFPGGVSSPALGPDQFDLTLDYDAMYDAGSSLGSGSVIVVGQGTCMVAVAQYLAEFFQQESCGKCKLCQDGPARTLRMLDRLDRINEVSIDLNGADGTAADNPLQVLNGKRGTSYTDTVKGLEKIRHLCELFKHLGDCHHITEAASSIQQLLALFPEEFEFHRAHSRCDMESIR